MWVCVYYCITYYKFVRVGEGEDMCYERRAEASMDEGPITHWGWKQPDLKNQRSRLPISGVHLFLWHIS
jgi:hypothetical protein